ncbi:D-aminoacylase [Paenibacillus sp. IB182496]|uniref:D-aminoacylase n=1 Tax=Paenibacillus sabuli TaxID=2772509 RepID=A0A927GSS3_9BACL|nr:D-aminoacylase [Paenibacillus sabuli]MBD2845972.1 D-aminoacylase [Paenibacillus sabuli]
MLDLIIKNGKIADGSGNPWYYGDVAVKDGKIAAVGRIEQEAARRLDAKGRVVAPGFIDGHCHSDLMIMNYPDSTIKLSQGVTTEVIGNCGLGPAPLGAPFAAQLKQYIQPVLGELHRHDWSWETLAQYRRAVEAVRPSENLSTYVPHGALRIAAMGFEDRPPTKADMARMRAMLEEGMQAGAIGLSIGLLYAPGSYATKEELAELCEVLPAYGGLLSTHIRGEGSHLIASLREVIWVAERAGVPLHVSHLKAAGRRNWGLVLEAMEIMADARARGMDVTCDVYPYAASSTMLTTVLPPWTLEGGIDATLARFGDPALRARIIRELGEEQDDWDNLVCSTGWDKVVIASVQTAANQAAEGRSIAELSAARGCHPVECVMDLLTEEAGNVAIVYFLMNEDDVRQVIQWDYALVASDSLHCDLGKPHPRLYGSFPRLFAKYVREERALSLEQAVRKLTSFPVQRFRLGERGLLVPGYAADLVVFDPATIQDHATFEQPKQLPGGISHVIVGGELTLEEGRHTQAAAGRFLSASGHVGCGHAANGGH